MFSWLKRLLGINEFCNKLRQINKIVENVEKIGKIISNTYEIKFLTHDRYLKYRKLRDKVYIKCTSNGIRIINKYTSPNPQQEEVYFELTKFIIVIDINTCTGVSASKEKFKNLLRYYESKKFKKKMKELDELIKELKGIEKEIEAFII